MTTKQDKPFILIDGSSYLFRAYYALPALNNKQGHPTGAMYGVVNMLRKLLHDYDPKYIAVVFDPKGKTFRHKLYPQYKANRKTMPDDLRCQIEPLFKIIQSLGLPLIIKDGFEADDVIGSLTTQAVTQGLEVLISTGDKDLTQLVNKQVTLINTMTNQRLDTKGVMEKFGVPPGKIIDYLTLVGDNADNVPGVPKVGPKTALKWLTEYGSLVDIVREAPNIPGKTGENLRSHLNILPTMRELVTIVLDLKLDINTNELVRKPEDHTTLIDLLQEFDFQSLLKEMTPSTHTKKTIYTSILDKKTWNAWFKKIKQSPVLALDTETTNKDAMRAELVGISFAVSQGEAAYLPLAHHYKNAPIQLNKQGILQQVQTILSDSKKKLIGHNLKYDIEILTKENLSINCTLWDSLLASYVLNGNQTRHNLDTLSLKYLNHQALSYESVTQKQSKQSKQLSFNEVPIDQATPYAAEDADLALQLYHYFSPKLKNKPRLNTLLIDIEIPLIPILAAIEKHGVLIDIKMLATQSKSVNRRIKILEKQAFDFVGNTFNLNSPKQLQTILYERLKLPILKKTPLGQPSTSESALQDLALSYPLPKIILEYRHLSKLQSTYLDRLPEQVNPNTGRVHTSYNQAVTATGRLSSNNPNLQNIPIRSNVGRKIRCAFIAPKGFYILASDYSQIELRIIAHLTHEPALIQAFKNNIDIHQSTASEVFHVKLNQVTTEQRRRAKTINFGLLYGMSAFGLSKQLSIERHIAQEYIDIYFQRYSKVYEYINETKAIAAKQGYVETLLGRRIYLPDICSSQVRRRQASERAAINGPMQGSAADIIKLAMILVHRSLQKHKVDAKMMMQVHDELVFEIRHPDIEIAKKYIQSAMEHTIDLSVPLLVNIGIGDNWEAAH